MRSEISQSRLQELLPYDPVTGVFRWKHRTSNRVHVGDVAGQVDRHGHRSINLDGLRYMAHRLAWLYVYGRWPKEEIDHKNLVKDDNWIDNLREATRAGNCRNVGRKKHNKSGYKGVVRYSQSRHKFMAQITVNGRPIYLGLFDNPQDAHAEYARASVKYHGEYGRTE